MFSKILLAGWMKKTMLPLMLGLTVIGIVILGNRVKSEYAKTGSTVEEEYPNLYAQQPDTFFPMTENTIYLTFDDGPSRNTEAILEICQQYSVKVTFFITGSNIEGREEIIKRAYDAGHTIALHCDIHDYNKIYSSLEAYLKDLNQVHEKLKAVTGEYPTLLRFPGGSANGSAPKAVMTAVRNEVTRRGFVYYDWNIVSGDDTSKVLPPETLFATIAKGIERHSSAVVLCHDAPLYTTTPKAIEQIIIAYQNKGYEFAPITSGLEPIQLKAPNI